MKVEIYAKLTTKHETQKSILRHTHILAKAAEHNHLPWFGQTKKHENTYFLQSNDRCQDGHLDEEYLQVPQASQRQLLPQEKILSGHHLRLTGAMGPERVHQTSWKPSVS